MRVLYLHQYFNTPDSPGGGVRSYEISKRLVAAGHEVEIVTADRRPDAMKKRTTTEDGVTVHWIPVPYRNEMTNAQRVWSFLKFAFQSMTTASSIPSDVVYATSTPLTVIIPAYYAKRRLRIPLVFEVRDLWPELPIAVEALRSKPAIRAARALEKFAYRSSERVVALSPGMQEGVEATGYPSDRIHMSPNASDVGFFDVPTELGQGFRNRHAWLGDRPLVIYVGTFGLLNGVDYLAEVAAEMQSLDPEVRFLAVGSGGGYDKLRATADRRGVWEKNLFVIDRIPKREVPEIYSAADIGTSLFIDLPEMQSNSANKFFDCLAAATPVAINYGGWHKEVLDDHGAGLHLAPHDHQQAAQQLLSALRDPQWLLSASKAARNLASNDFNRDLLTSDLEQMLVETVADADAVPINPT